MHVFFFCLFLQLSPQSSPSQRSLLPHFIVAHSPLLASAIGRSLISLQISDPQLFPWHEVFQLLFPQSLFLCSSKQASKFKSGGCVDRVNAVPRH
jgi:hypothetical protein